jgi:hypothetical protein
MPYVTPTGGSRQPTPKPAPTLGRITMTAWRQPVGGVRPASTTPPATRR